MLAAHGHRGNYIIHVARDDQPDGNLPVVRGIRRVQRAGACIETHLTPYRAG